MLAVKANQASYDYAKTLALLDEGIDLFPGYGNFYESKGNIALYLGENEKAITCLEKALEISPQKMALNLKIAEAFISSGKYREAIGKLLGFVKISPRPVKAYYLLGQSYMQLKEYDKAREYYEKAIEIRPNYHEINYGLATIYMRLGQRDKAKQYMEVYRNWQANKARRRETRVNVNRTDVYNDSSHQNIAVFSECLVKLCVQGINLYKAEQNIDSSEELFSKGKEILEQVIRIAPNRPAVYRYFALMYLSTNRNLVQAKQFAEKAVALRGSEENYYTLGSACYKNSDRAGALSAIEKAIELDPDNMEYRQRYNMIKERK
jgi:tetratricopeptide (TPR) repeat protein